MTIDDSKRLAYSSSVRSRSTPNPRVLSMLADERSTSEHRIRGCRHLIEMGCLRQASVALRQLLRTDPDRVEAKSLLTACEQLQAVVGDQSSQQSGVERPLLDENLQGGDVWTTSGGHDATILAFAGAAIRVGVSVQLLQRLFSRFACNTIFVFDHRRSFYLGGVESLGSDVSSTVRALRSLIDDLATRRLYCIGQSMGGFAAILYGQALRARGILAFSPMVSGLLYAAERQRVSQIVGRPLRRADVDVAAMRGPGAPPLHIVHGAENAGDVKAAALLAGMPGVEVTAIEGLAAHSSLPASVVGGSFVGYVERLLAC